MIKDKNLNTSLQALFIDANTTIKEKFNRVDFILAYTTSVAKKIKLLESRNNAGKTPTDLAQQIWDKQRENLVGS